MPDEKIHWFQVVMKVSVSSLDKERVIRDARLIADETITCSIHTDENIRDIEDAISMMAEAKFFEHNIQIESVVTRETTQRITA